MLQENLIRSCLLFLLSLNTDDPISNNFFFFLMVFSFSTSDEDQFGWVVSCIIFFRHELSKSEDRNGILIIS